MVVQASKLSLPLSSLSSSSSLISSLLFDPVSLSLALMHHDSSISLYPSFSPLCSSSLPSPTAITSSAAAAFVLSCPKDWTRNRNPSTIFIVAGPDNSRTAMLLRFWVHRKSKAFFRARVRCAQNDLRSHDSLGVVVKSCNGISIKIAGSVNYFCMYSASNSKIWVFGVKMGDDGCDDANAMAELKLAMCAVVECTLPAFSIAMSPIFLVLGERSGVRVLPLRSLVKGEPNKQRSQHMDGNFRDESPDVGRVLNLPNSLEDSRDVKKFYSKKTACSGGVKGKTVVCHVYLDQLHGEQRLSDIAYRSSYFVEFDGKGVHTTKKIPVKAVSVHALSSNKFLILDTHGDIHMLCISSPISITGRHQMRKLTHMMNAQNLAVFCNCPIGFEDDKDDWYGENRGKQIFWISDGSHSVHIVTFSVTSPDSDGNYTDKMLAEVSVADALFTSERVQDIVPMAPNSALILAQGEIYAYSLS